MICRLHKWNVTLTVKDFPHLPSLAGCTLITTDGTTVLGADDKAGVAEIMTMAEALIKENIPHGPISIAFTPDEEVGGGTDHFNVENLVHSLPTLWMAIPKAKFNMKTSMHARQILKLQDLLCIPVPARIR